VWAGCGGAGSPASYDPVEIALVHVEPVTGSSLVPRNRPVRIVFNTAVLPESIHDQSVRVRIAGGKTRPAGSFLISGNVVEFVPTRGADGRPNAGGFPAGASVSVEVPLFTPGASKPASSFVRNVEGNPITVGTGHVAFTTGAQWDDPVPGAPGVLGVEFTPGPDVYGQVDPGAAVTLVFSEPIDPGTVSPGSNLFLTNDTDTSALYRLPVRATAVFDGTLTRLTLIPLFGFGRGPYTIRVGFLDPQAPESFDPTALPRDLGGHAVANFTYAATFDTRFDPDIPNAGMLEEDFTLQTYRDAAETTAAWGDDALFPFTLAAPPLGTRLANVAVETYKQHGMLSDMPHACSALDVLTGPDVTLPTGAPPVSAGRRFQNIYRAAEIGGGGTIVGAAWRSWDGSFSSFHERVIVRLGHKTADADLAATGFDAEFDVGKPVTVADRAYSVPQTAPWLPNVTSSNKGLLGWVEWPAFDAQFEYDGIHDLLIDVQATPGTATQWLRMRMPWTGNGCKTLNAAGQANCVAVTTNTPDCAPNASIGIRKKSGTFGSDDRYPTVPVGTLENPTPMSLVMRFEIATTTGIATSRYYDAGIPTPDYLAPLVSPLVQPGGARIELEWAGSHDGVVDDVPFTPDIHQVDGYRYIRWRAKLKSNFITGVRARIDRIEIPFTFD
jgi:hypothetical protein